MRGSKIPHRKYQQRRELSADARVLATADVLEKSSDIGILGVGAICNDIVAFLHQADILRPSLSKRLQHILSSACIQMSIISWKRLTI